MFLVSAVKDCRPRNEEASRHEILSGIKWRVLEMDTKNLALPRLNQLNPTLESTALKLMEEAGELAQCIGKYRGLSGEVIELDEATVVEEIAKELLDVAQTAVTMMFVMEESYGVDVEQMLCKHLQKLRSKGYLTGADTNR
jgi:NTP pyrophosphatase (non-canonical NTP hydrolase)